MSETGWVAFFTSVGRIFVQDRGTQTPLGFLYLREEADYLEGGSNRRFPGFHELCQQARHRDAE